MKQHCPDKKLAVTESHYVTRVIPSIGEIEGLVRRIASANQDVRGNIVCEKPKEWWPCLTHVLKRSIRPSDRWFLIQTFTMSSDTCSLIAREVRCNQMMQGVSV